MARKIFLTIVCIFFINLFNGYFFRTNRVTGSVADAVISKSKSDTTLTLEE